MAYAYARKPEGRTFVHHEHNAKFGQTQLADYLIKTVPKYITMVSTRTGTCTRVH